MPSLSLSANVVWHSLGEIRANRSIDLVFFGLFQTHNAVVVESGCKGHFHSTKCFLECHLFKHPSFPSFSFYISISTYLHLFLCCSFLSLRDPRQNELIQMSLSVGGCRSFPASFSCKGRKELFLAPPVMCQDFKHESVHVCIYSVYVHMHTQMHTQMCMSFT